jgi:tetratricopeptide (TPR) repeat protein
MQILSEFEPGMDTLVMKPLRGSVSAAAPFPGTAEREKQTRESEAPELQALILRVKKLVSDGKTEAAAGLYEEICAQFPNSGKVWMQRFNLARKQRLYGTARQIIQESLKHCPGNAILWQAWADLERSLGRLNVARKLYRKGLEANPYLPSLYNSWGAMERGIGRTDAARRLFQEGLTHDANSVRLLLSQGVLEDVEGNPKLARSLLRRGLLVEPGNAFLLHALGMVEYKAGDIARAREAFRAAVTANMDHTQSWLAWAQLEEAQGNIDVARSNYVLGCKSRGSRGSVQLWQAWARMEEQHTDGRAALEVYRKATLLFPHDSQMLVESAKTLAKLGDVAEASTMLRRALDIDAHNPYVYQCLARIEMRQHRVAEALRLFATGVAMAEKGFSKALSADGKERKSSGGGVSRGSASETTMGKRELADLVHSWANVEEEHGEDVNATRALYAKATALDPQRVRTSPARKRVYSRPASDLRATCERSLREIWFKCTFEWGSELCVDVCVCRVTFGVRSPNSSRGKETRSLLATTMLVLSTQRYVLQHTRPTLALPVLPRSNGSCHRRAEK